MRAAATTMTDCSISLAWSESLIGDRVSQQILIARCNASVQLAVLVSLLDCGAVVDRRWPHCASQADPSLLSFDAKTVTTAPSLSKPWRRRTGRNVQHACRCQLRLG